MLTRAYRYFFPPPIRDRAALGSFMSGEAAYLAQRSTYEFTRNTLAWHGQAAFGDREFNDVFRICRWEAFGAVLSGFSLLAFARLAPGPGGRRGDLEAAMVKFYGDLLGAYETPRHRTDWADELAALAERLHVLPPGSVGDGGRFRILGRGILGRGERQGEQAADDRFQEPPPISQALVR